MIKKLRKSDEKITKKITKKVRKKYEKILSLPLIIFL